MNQGFFSFFLHCDILYNPDYFYRCTRIILDKLGNGSDYFFGIPGNRMYFKGKVIGFFYAYQIDQGLVNPFPFRNTVFNFICSEFLIFRIKTINTLGFIRSPEIVCYQILFPISHLAYLLSTSVPLFAFL